MVTKIGQLEQYLPYTIQNDQIQKVLKELLVKKKEAQVVYFKHKDEQTELNKKITSIKTQINEF